MYEKNIIHFIIKQQYLIVFSFISNQKHILYCLIMIVIFIFINLGETIISYIDNFEKM